MDGQIAGRSHTTEAWRPLRLLQLLPEVLAIVACAAAIWGAVAFTLWQAHSSALDAARRQTATLARAFAEASERITTGVDRQLLALRASMAEKGAAFDIREWERTQSPTDAMTLQIGIAGTSGRLLQSTIPLTGPPVDIGDRDYFKTLLNSPADRPAIGKPVFGRVSKRWTVHIARKIVGPDGAFAGVAMTSVSCDDLSRFYEASDLDGGFVMLAGQDGIVRGFGPERPDALGADLSVLPSFAASLSQTEGTIDATLPWDGERRIVSFRRLAQYPLIVMAGFNDARVFGEYTRIRLRAIEIGTAATLIILLLGGIWLELRVRSAASRRALLLTLENMSQGIVLVDAHGRIPVINPRAVKLLDLPAGLLEPAREMQRGEATALGLDEKIAPTNQEPAILHKNGRIIEAVAEQIPGGGQVRTFTDVTERRIAEARIRHMTHHDPLTGLANRMALNERIGELARTAPAGGFGLIWLDLDGFKTVNETLGHDAGDRVLREMGRRLHTFRGKFWRNEITLARTGGDKFAIVCAGDNPMSATPSLAGAIVAAIGDPADIDGTQFRLSASAGISFFPEDGITAAELLRHAVTAMDHAKSRGKGSIVNFDPEMDRALQERAQIERDLRTALSNRALEVWFQPRFEAASLRISGFEALARWRHPERGFIPPSQFIPVAEQCGLIADLGIQVLTDACAFAASLPDGRIAVNLSPVQFLSDNLPELIGEALERSDLSPSRLELEITEGVLIADEDQALDTLKRLHERRLHLALDDFGTGYASLSYLRRFPFDRIKIDQSFVREQEHDATTRAIVESMMTMARRLSLEVTAEGVETERQLNMLLSQGCPEVQGYYLGRPMPAEEARAFHARHASSDARLLTGPGGRGNLTAA